MAQSLSNVLIHTVFSTKDRCPHIIGPLQPEMHAYLAKICQSLGCFVFKIGGVEDHVHLFTTLPRTLSQSSFIEEIKTCSSKWIKSKHPDLKSFSWQRGFGIFSICPTHINALIHYIGTQAEHHKVDWLIKKLCFCLSLKGASFIAQSECEGARDRATKGWENGVNS